MTAFESEAALAAFIRQQLDRLPLAGFVSQLQGSLAQGGKLLKLRVGAAVVPFGAAGATANVTVAHGMGSTPVAVFCTYASAVVQGLFAYVNTVGATTFQISATSTAAPGADQTVYWLAIG